MKDDSDMLFHECPECNMRCNCSDQPCSCCHTEELQKALEHPIWKAHKISNTYKMDGKGEWKIAYYPIFECGKTGEVYDSPRALVEQKAIWNGVEGTDFREVPLHYLELNSL